MNKELINQKVNKARLNKSKPFNNSELEETLKNINLGRARDPEGLCAELLKDSLLLI